MVKPSCSSSHINSDVAKFKGIRKRKWGKWVAEIRLPNSRERIWLGSHDTAEKAARAFDAALFCLRGNTANFNFPHQPPHIPGGRSLPRDQIQAAAAHYANHHTDISSPSSSSSSVSTDNIVETDQDEQSKTSPVLYDDITYLNILDINTNTNSYTSVPDFGIFPGFDDYFMAMPPATDYGEEICDGIYVSDLWNF